MQVTEHLHAVRIPFTIPLSPEISLDRFVYVFICMADAITLIDSGVNGANSVIFQAIRDHGRDLVDVDRLILSHSHPDHLGAARAIKNATNCRICSHENDGYGSRIPCANFRTGLCLVSSNWLAVRSRSISSSEMAKSLNLAEVFSARLSIALAIQWVPFLCCLPETRPFLPVIGQKKIQERMSAALSYLEEIHDAVLTVASGTTLDMMDLCRQVVDKLGLPPAAVNPLVARAFASSLSAQTA